jgi:hypothetical protein
MLSTHDGILCMTGMNCRVHEEFTGKTVPPGIWQARGQDAIIF